jgi:NAD(P)-dependent dehydrogenase (short-subunit alcohol dehydrogenase family)
MAGMKFVNGGTYRRFTRLLCLISLSAMSSKASYAILGGTSGMGLALAERLVSRGDHVLIGGRSPGRLAAALDRLGEGASGRTVDVLDRGSIEAFFADAPPLSGLFTPAATYRTGAFRDGDTDTSEALFQGKFWSQYWSVFAALPHLLPHAGVVLMSGAASARPLGAAAYAACNAALEGLARGLAVELSPLRVNCLSPGTTDTPYGAIAPPSSARRPIGNGTACAWWAALRASRSRPMPRSSCSTMPTSPAPRFIAMEAIRCGEGTQVSSAAAQRAVIGTSIISPASSQKAITSPTALAIKPMPAGPARIPA